MRLERFHKGWKRCWNFISARYGGPYIDEMWQYLETVGDGVTDNAYHQFRMDFNGQWGRCFCLIPVESGDFEEV